MIPRTYYRRIDGHQCAFKRPMILLIVGESGSGKTSLSLYLQQRYWISSICSCTTRPRREDEMPGREHWFMTPEDIPSRDQMLAYTKFGGFEYWADVNDVKPDVNTYVIDEKGVIDLYKNWGGFFTLVPIYISRPNNPTDKKRTDRDKERVLLEEKEYAFTIINDYDCLDDFLVNASKQIINFIIRYTDGGTD